MHQQLNGLQSASLPTRSKVAKVVNLEPVELPSSLTVILSSASTEPPGCSNLPNSHSFLALSVSICGQCPTWQISLSSKKHFPLMGPDLVWLLYLKTFSVAWRTFPPNHSPHSLTPPRQLSISPPLLTVISWFFFPSSINFLLLSPCKNPPLLFVGACLIAISVTPYYISNDWLWALIRDVLGRADLAPSPPPPSCFSAELLPWLHRCGDTISTAPLRVASPDC